MVKLNKIYTRTGDDGTTGLVDGSRSAKHSARIAAIGTVDEANSAIGAAIVPLPSGKPAATTLLRVQNDLFDLGADLATPKGALEDDDFSNRAKWYLAHRIRAQVEWLERANRRGRTRNSNRSIQLRAARRERGWPRGCISPARATRAAERVGGGTCGA